MKAIINEKYGLSDVLQIKEIEKPMPKDDEVLIKVIAVSINMADWHLLTADIFLVRFMEGLFKPKNKVLGADVSGIVEAVGKKVTLFQPGDAVIGDLTQCGWGGLAEYTCAKENALIIKPDSLLFEEAAALPMAGVTALQGLRNKAQIKAGQKVLINGASGGVGTFAVQMAKHYGAEVTAVCSTGKIDLVRSLGADHVIDYTKEDFTQNGKHYDLIFAVNGYHPLSAYKRALAPNGKYFMVGGASKQMFQALLLGAIFSSKGKKLGAHAAKADANDLADVVKLVADGKVKPVIDRCYTFEKAAEAFAYLGAGHASGKVVIKL
jgi:NADPH:quinone reductase-like Zn-dependent oxidoreductase